MSLKVDLNKLSNLRDTQTGMKNIDCESVKSSTIACDSLKIGNFTLTNGETLDKLFITKDDIIIAEYKDNCWLLNGKSIGAIWETLENHYEAIKKILNK